MCLVNWCTKMCLVNCIELLGQGIVWSIASHCRRVHMLLLAQSLEKIPPPQPGFKEANLSKRIPLFMGAPLETWCPCFHPLVPPSLAVPIRTIRSL